MCGRALQTVALYQVRSTTDAIARRSGRFRPVSAVLCSRAASLVIEAVIFMIVMAAFGASE